MKINTNKLIKVSLILIVVGVRCWRSATCSADGRALPFPETE